MQLHKKPAYSYGSMYNGVHCVQLYGEEVPPGNVGEWVEQTAERYYDQAAAFFDSAISSIDNAVRSMVGGVEIGNSKTASGVGIADSAHVVMPTKITVSDDSVKTKTVLFGFQIGGYGVSFDRETTEAIPDSTSGN